MNDIIYDNYRRAGKIAADARDYGVTLLKPGTLFLDVATEIENRIKKNGAHLAFPVNISINTIAAHYSPRHDDQSTFKKGDLVKLDVGAHIDGYIADTAITAEIETQVYQKMIQASSEALTKAISILNVKIPLSEIGKTIGNTITSYGYKPIHNLMGHGLNQYELHSGLSIPNIGSIGSKTKLKNGDVVAIEPFATNGAGYVIAGEGSNIYLCTNSLKAKLIRDAKTKYLFEKIYSHYKTLPFAERWCHHLNPITGDIGLKKLSILGLTKQYPQLIEAKNGMVTQKEHTVIIKEDGCEVIT
jgi:methionyl aminopeptidase